VSEALVAYSGKTLLQSPVPNVADRAEIFSVYLSTYRVEPFVPSAGRLAVTSVAESCSCGCSIRCVQWADVVADTSAKRGGQGRLIHKIIEYLWCGAFRAVRGAFGGHVRVGELFL
jgi:hypothetical protein